jgi:hypothetical protein
LEECVKDCAQSSVGVPILKETQNKVCDLDLDIGPCRAYFEKYYYNKQTKKCEPFGWGGCKGNSNKFNSIEECERECVSETKDTETQKNTEIQSEDSNLTDEKVLNKPSSEICQLKKDTGNCKAYISKFYFNSSTKRCESFIWSGCGGKLY